MNTVTKKDCRGCVYDWTNYGSNGECLDMNSAEMVGEKPNCWSAPQLDHDGHLCDFRSEQEYQEMNGLDQ